MDQHQTEGAERTVPPRPVIYVRSAVNDEAKLAQRLENTQELAHLHSLDVGPDDCIAEHGSGADISRPGLQRILAMAERGEISHVVTLRPSHLSRDYHDLRQTLVTMAEAGVRVITGHGTNEPGVAPDLIMQPLFAKG